MFVQPKVNSACHVRKRPQASQFRFFGAAFLAFLSAGGCGAVVATDDGSPPRTTLSLSSLDLDNSSTFFESTPNDAMSLAERVQVGAGSRVISGRITDGFDIDVFDLGPVARGDRILVTMANDPTLDGVIALFDGDGDALLVNDHRNVYLGETTPFIDVVARRTESSCFVAVSATPGYGSYGDYGLVASKQPGVPLLPYRPDVILLVFDGAADVRIGGRAPVIVPAFDAANIDGKYAGKTSAMVRDIVAAIRDDYRSFHVTVLSTSEGARDDGTMTRVFFGTFDPALLGVAEGIDEFNAMGAQDAIVFTDTFSAFMQLDPTVVQMAAAIANVASHEAGHLLGLVHTSDPFGIMDVTASLSDLLHDQDFRRSPIYADVFPIGYQDAVQTLLDTVGGDALLNRVKQIVKDLDMSRYRVDSDKPPARSSFQLSTCGLDHP